MSLRLAIVSLEGGPFDGEVESVVLPGLDGSFGVMPGHAPMVAELGKGQLKVRQGDGASTYFVIRGGVVQVSRDRMTVAAEGLEKAISQADSARRARILRRTGA